VISDAEFLQARILVVDDQAANIMLLERMLSGAGYLAVASTSDPRAVCELHRANGYDLILLDLQMPDMDGFEVLEALKQVELDGYVPVLVVTAQPAHKLRALQAGAKDFVSKPFEIAEVLTRVHNMLEVRLYAKALARTVRELEASQELIRAKNAELKKLFDEVVAERKISERLALKVPANSIVERLQARPDVTASTFPDVTVLVADVVGLAGQVPTATPERLVEMVEELFALFDARASRRGLRKVKTLGNSYMAAAGVPVPAADHAEQAAHLALDLLEELEGFNQRTGSRLQVRIGLHTGLVVAGLIGRSQFLYDLWGEAVIIAGRMESHGVAGHAQVSESTRRLLAEPFLFEEHGTQELEGQAELKTWFLVGRHGSSD
jgi:adenylate cyclase